MLVGWSRLEKEGTIPRNSYRVCSLHLTKKDYTDCWKERLNRGSVPSINGPSLMADTNQNEGTSSPTNSPGPSTPLPNTSTHLPIPYTPLPITSISPASSISMVLSTPKSAGKRLSLRDIRMSCLAHCSPRKKLLYLYGKGKEQELRKLEASNLRLKSKVQEMMASGKQQGIIGILESCLSKSAASLFATQMRVSNKKPKGRRWTRDDKIHALTVYKKSPKCYRYLCSMYALPCIRTLQRLLGSWPFSVGIHRQALQNVVQSLAGREPHHQLCLLLFDEMSIRPHFDYKVANDSIVGFEDLGTVLGRTNKPAKYALVFMIRGLLQDWKQPIASFFSGSPTNAERLKEILQMIIEECSAAGLTIISTVYDMGSSNVKALKIMGSTPDTPVIDVAGQEYITMFDTPHLLKSTRNLFLKYHVRLPVEVAVEGSSITVPGVAKWSNIEQAFELDGRKSEFRTLYKLTSIHMQPKGRSKLRVGIAAQVLSRTVSNYLWTGYTNGFLPASALATSTFVSQVNSMFDSMNGGVTLDRYHQWKAPVTRKSGHQEFWRSCRKLVDNWEFLEGSNSVIRRPPTVKGWLTTLAAMDLIWSKVAAIKEVQKLSTRRINQDPLENFFGCIRAQCGSNRDPTMSSFMDAWKTCIFSGLAIEGSLRGTNCLRDGGNILGSFQEFEDGDVPVTIPTSPPESPLTILDHCSLNSTADLCHVIARDGLQFSDCSYCRSGLLEVQLREDPVWKCLRMETVQGEEHYTYPSMDLVRSVSASMNLVLAFLDGGPPRVGVTRTILDRLQGSDSFGWILCCPIHGDVVKERVVLKVVENSMKYWCQERNLAFKMPL